MHLPDGFLSAPVNIASAGTVLLLATIAIKKTSNEMEEKLIPIMGVTSAFIFAAQMLNFPIGAGTSGHFLGAFFATMIFGPWASLLIMSMVLVLQSLMFGDGGITSLGTNIFNMGVIGGIIPWFLFSLGHKILPKNKKVFLILTGFCAWFSVVLASFVCALEIGFSGVIPLKIVIPAMVGVHSVIGIGETVITIGAVSLLIKQKPEYIPFLEAREEAYQ